MATEDPVDVAAKVGTYIREYQLAYRLQRARYAELCQEHGLELTSEDAGEFIWDHVFDEIPTPQAPYRWLNLWEDYEDRVPESLVALEQFIALAMQRISEPRLRLVPAEPDESDW